MVDIICKYCGEPWSYYHLNHELDEGEQVLSGKGCPSCNWGKNIESPQHAQEWRKSLMKIDEDPLKYL